MTNYSPCFNCARDKDACARRAEIRAAIKGAGISSVKFRCDARLPKFATGQRVHFDWSSWDNDGYEESCLHLTFSGTVIRERGTKFVVQVDDADDINEEGIPDKETFTKNGQLLIKVRPGDMRAIAEPQRSVCPTCYAIAGSTDDRCYLSDGQVWKPAGCISNAGGAA